jgi:DNA-binding XRE family transcriptional regulator
MNAIETLAKRLAARFPEAQMSIDRPSKRKGSWWLDVNLEGHPAVVEWHPRKGFGVSTGAAQGYGEGPDEIYRSLESAFTRVSNLLTGRERTMPVREVVLKQLRESRKISQEQLAHFLKIRQATLSKMERRRDMYVSTLERFITGLGGKLEIKAVFPEGSVEIVQMEEESR